MSCLDRKYKPRSMQVPSGWHVCPISHEPLEVPSPDFPLTLHSPRERPNSMLNLKNCDSDAKKLMIYER